MRTFKTSILIAGVFFLNCNAPHNLETRIGSHRAEGITATAKKEFDYWIVDMELPIGEWVVKPNEDQPIEMLPGSPKSRLRWKVSPERWANREKPFIMELISRSGSPIHISIRYTQLTAGDFVALTVELFRISLWF
jgi:hypothetical protein